MSNIIASHGSPDMQTGASETRLERAETIFLQGKPRLNPEVQGTTLEGETVLLHLTSGHYYTLNRVGTAIWELCDGKRTLEEIHQALCARFDVPPQRAHDDLAKLVHLLEQKGLLRIER